MPDNAKGRNPTGKSGPQILPSHLHKPIDARSTRATTVQFHLILEVVAKIFDVRVAAIKSNTKSKSVAEARDVAIYLIRHQLKLSFPVIGRIFKKDHSTIISALRRATKRIERDPFYATKIQHLLKDPAKPEP